MIFHGRYPLYQELVVAPDAVIYGGTGATDAALWWHRFLSLLGDAVLVAAAGYGTTAFPAFRQDVGSAWVDVSRVGCIGSACFGVSGVGCVERFDKLLCVGFARVVCVSISVDYNAVCKGILETFGVPLGPMCSSMTLSLNMVQFASLRSKSL